MTGIWSCGRFRLALDPPLVMGVVNVTPDSFSDGGEHFTPDAAIAHGRELAAAGADILDVGGESTRPGSDEVPPADELARVLPVVEALAGPDGPGLPVSIDTRHADVAGPCVEAGASIINDVAGFRDAAMLELAVSCDAGVVVMHMLGEPKTMQDEPEYEDVVREVSAWLAARTAALETAGVAHDRIVIDPGIGFGKTLEHNLALLRGLPELRRVGFPVLVGASRKRFIGALTGEAEPRMRLGGSLAVATTAVLGGAAVLRVHDVAETVQAVRVAAALREG
ncbi:MAG: dihydropteroate synthase [Actinobacteria bacterium]|nr:MAG: dihydropteroate synthase [Actinomycetota bacterium]